jgi:hypothetical protein
LNTSKKKTPAIRRQLANPGETVTVEGPDVGLPVDVTVTYRRGFVEAVSVARRDLFEVRAFLFEHPVGLVWVADTGAAVAIARADDWDEWTGPENLRPRRPWVAHDAWADPVPPTSGRPEGRRLAWRRRRRDLIDYAIAWAITSLPQWD